MLKAPPPPPDEGGGAGGGGGSVTDRVRLVSACSPLEKAWKLRDPGLEQLKMDPLMAPLRGEPRYQAIIKALKFPESHPRA